MAFGFRYRIKNKDGAVVKRPNVFLAMTPDGMPFVVDNSGYYTSVTFLSCPEYTVELATEKIDGKWLYKPV